MQDAGTALLRHPGADYAMLWAGALIGGVYATWAGDELHIVTGAEIALMALLRLAIKDQMRWFFVGLATLAALMPVVAVTTAPLFYFGDLNLDAVLETGGVALGPALLLGGFAAWGARHARPPSPEPPPNWVRHVERGLGWAVVLMALALGSGQWGLPTVAATLLGALGAFAGLVALLWLRLKLTRRGVGAVLLAVGAFVVAGGALLVATQGGRVSVGEASLAMVPGAALALLGLVVLAVPTRGA
ncbi:MAG: hypothetical protein H6741_23780 [Alphaproteobacteria bacterium]|nr:hypothetical protein [Alphaproteobacteria bacterium]